MKKEESYIPKDEVMRMRREMAKERQIAITGVIIIEVVVIGLLFLIHWITPDFLRSIMTVAITIFGTIGVFTPFILLRIVWVHTSDKINKLNQLSPDTKPYNRPTFNQVVGYRWRRLKELLE